MTAAPQLADSPESAGSRLLGGVDALLVAADSDLGSAALDLAVGPALLRAVTDLRSVSGTSSTGWLRMYRPVPTVGFSRRDSKVPNYSRAVIAARGHGFEPAVRSPGGRAAAYHRSCLCFELVLPDSGERGPAQQMSALGDLVAGVLRDLGVDARVGEVPGEYCPGRFSVNAGGVAKIVGTAGRRVRGAILLGGSIIVADAAPIRAVLSDVYPALGLPLDPATVAAATDFGCTVENADAVADALVSALGTHSRVSHAPLPAHVVAAAHTAVTALPIVG
jgi:lipoate-protein ligase A